MSEALKKLPPAVAQSLEAWHRMAASGDLSRLAEIVHSDALFRSPMAALPYASAAAVILALKTAVTVFEDFAYHRELATDDGHSIVLEFSARVGDKKLKGIDLIRFDADGKIVEFEVMVRPMSGLQALGAAMAERVGTTLPQFKAKGM